MGLRVAVVDSGMDLAHPALICHAARDSRGRLIRYDFVHNRAAVTDAYGHGTHIGSLITAALQGSGVVLELADARVLDAQGRGHRSSIARAIRWSADQGARVINLSTTFPTYDADVDAAVQYAWRRGAVLVAAGGNTGREEVRYPAGYLNVLGVAAADETGRPWSGSTSGPHIDLAAPGLGRPGLRPRGLTVLHTVGAFGPVRLSGTSQAAALVSAEAARLAGVNPLWSNRMIADWLKATAGAPGQPWTPRLGYGVLREQGDPVRQTGELQVQVAPPGTVQALQIDGQVYGLDAAGMARARGVPPGEHLLSLAWAGSTAFSPPVTVNIAPSTTFSLRIDASDFS